MSQPIVVNPDIIEMEYAVRGPLAQRAVALKRQGRTIIPCHIGNPQALGQEPIAYYREILSLLESPSRIARERRLNRLPASAGLPAEDRVADELLDFAEATLTRIETGMGAYTETGGHMFIREAIARFIDRRDDIGTSGGPKADPEHIYLTNGASEGARFILEMLIAGRTDGIMIPTPQYPLYSATIRKCGGTQVNYYPDEDSGWTLTPGVLDEAMTKARADGVTVKAIVVINPGNPTGAILDEESVEGVIRFAGKHGLVIIADEVYQENVYGGRFVSFARKIGGRGIPLLSLHSTSKGYYGECGHRGGYIEARNLPPVSGTEASFTDLLRKQASVNLCSNTAGQLLTYLMVTPPAGDGPVRERFVRQKETVLKDLFDKATMIREAFGGMEGVKCFGRTGAMYLFPRLEKLPAGGSDFDYCMSLLESTGICTVNGAGFGQKAGTSHLRIAFLPSMKVLEEALPRWIGFHNDYVRRG